MGNEMKDQRMGAADAPQSGGSKPRRLAWVVGAWAIVAIGLVALALPRGREANASATPSKVAPAAAPETQASVSSLTNQGNLVMAERGSDPEAITRALELFERAYALDPDHLGARFGLAWARQVKGLPDSEWRDFYDQTVAEGSSLVYLALYNLAYAERQAGRHADAATFLARALRVMPERADGWLAAGSDHMAMGDSARAVADLRRAVELDPASSRGFYLLGQANRSLGQPKEAEAAWNQALRLDPTLKDQIEADRKGPGSAPTAPSR